MVWEFQGCWRGGFGVKAASARSLFSTLAETSHSDFMRGMLSLYTYTRANRSQQHRMPRRYTCCTRADLSQQHRMQRRYNVPLRVHLPQDGGVGGGRTHSNASLDHPRVSHSTPSSGTRKRIYVRCTHPPIAHPPSDPPTHPPSLPPT